jgi:hypothetical protein
MRPYLFARDYANNFRIDAEMREMLFENMNTVLSNLKNLNSCTQEQPQTLASFALFISLLCLGEQHYYKDVC